MTADFLSLYQKVVGPVNACPIEYQFPPYRAAGEGRKASASRQAKSTDKA